MEWRSGAYLKVFYMILINGYVHISLTVIRYVKVGRHASYVEYVLTVRTVLKIDTTARQSR